MARSALRIGSAAPRARFLVLGAFVVLLLGLSFEPGAASTRYDLSLSVDWSDRSFTGQEAIDWTNPADRPLDGVFLRLYPNAPSLFGSGSLEVSDVFADGLPASSTLSSDRTILEVRLPVPLASGASVHLALSFTGRPATWEEPPSTFEDVGYGTFASSSRIMTLASFYPILAPFLDGAWDLDPVNPIGDAVTSDFASYALAVTTDCGVAVVASGEPRPKESTSTGCRFGFAAEGMRDVMVVVGDAFDESTRVEGGVLLRASFLPEHAAAARIALDRAARALRLYGRLFGPYAWTELDLVEAPLSHAAGVEYPGLILIGEDYCDRPGDLVFDVVVAHEVAHQWWYAAVGNDVVKEPWLDEGLATFSSKLVLQEVRGEDAAQGMLASWQSAYGAARQERPDLSVASPTSAFPDSTTYSGFVYSGGALFLDALSHILGDEAFFRVLGQYSVDENQKIASGVDLVRRFAQATSADLSGPVIEYLGPEIAAQALPSRP